MAENTVPWNRGSLGLLALTVALLMATLALRLGPGARSLAGLRQQQTEAVGRLEAWQEHNRLEGAVPEDQLQAWADAFARAREGAPRVRDEVAQRSALRALLDIPGVPDPSIERRELLPGRSLEPLLLEAASRQERIELQALPYRIEWVGDFRSAARVLGRLEHRTTLLRVERLEIERAFPELSVRLDVLLFARAEPMQPDGSREES